MNDAKQGAVTSYLNWILRLEGFTVFFCATVFYYLKLEGAWEYYFLVFFLPDLGFLGYVLGPKIGAFSYNLLHTYCMPFILWAICQFVYFSPPNLIFLVWVAHIGFDRFLGFGLKYADGFKFTHLGQLNFGKRDMIKS